MKKILINSKKEMADLAREIAASARIGDVIGLKGTLGAGKSFFAKNFVNSLQEKQTEILSPTFNLVYSYDTKKGEVFHFDLYRIKDARELENIGIEDALQNGISLIEWPEIAEKSLKKNYTEVEIKIISGANEEAREVLINKVK
jgi:tRNA threonylcarbamoyladenosine biosynthesis protein TsaE